MHFSQIFSFIYAVTVRVCSLFLVQTTMTFSPQQEYHLQFALPLSVHTVKFYPSFPFHLCLLFLVSHSHLNLQLLFLVLVIHTVITIFIANNVSENILVISKVTAPHCSSHSKEIRKHHTNQKPSKPMEFASRPPSNHLYFGLSS